MKFLITRASTSAYKPDQKPCEKAVKLEGDCYGIKLKSLDDLMAIVKEAGCPIIIYPVFDESMNPRKCPAFYYPTGKDLPVIQIYDDYLE